MSTGPAYEVRIKNPAAKAIRKLPIEVRRTVQGAIRGLATDPRPHGYLKLTDSDGLYRIRCGNYRVIYEIEDGALIVHVVKVADRKEAY